MSDYKVLPNWSIFDKINGPPTTTCYNISIEPWVTKTYPGNYQTLKVATYMLTRIDTRPDAIELFLKQKSSDEKEYDVHILTGGISQFLAASFTDQAKYLFGIPLRLRIKYPELVHNLTEFQNARSFDVLAMLMNTFETDAFDSEFIRTILPEITGLMDANNQQLRSILSSLPNRNSPRPERSMEILKNFIIHARNEVANDFQASLMRMDVPYHIFTMSNNNAYAAKFVPVIDALVDLSRKSSKYGYSPKYIALNYPELQQVGSNASGDLLSAWDEALKKHGNSNSKNIRERCVDNVMLNLAALAKPK